jgi:hypothetical protein
MDPMHSMRAYPREDNIFRTKTSLNFDMMRAKIFDERKGKGLLDEVWLWIAHGICGVLVAFIAFGMSWCEHALIELRMHTVQDLIN